MAAVIGAPAKLVPGISNAVPSTEAGIVTVRPCAWNDCEPGFTDVIGPSVRKVFGGCTGVSTRPSERIADAPCACSSDVNENNEAIANEQNFIASSTCEIAAADSP